MTGLIEILFYDDKMRALGTDEQMLAQIGDVCCWYATEGTPAELAEFAHITAGRTGLLARYAGRSLRRRDTGPDATVHELGA